MSLPVLPDNARSKDVAESLAQVGSEYVELFNKRSKGEASESDLAALKERSAFILDLDPIQRALAAAEEIQRGAEQSQSRGPQAAFDDVSLARNRRSIGQQVVENDVYKSFQGRQADGTHKDFNVSGSLHNQRTLLTTSYTDTPQAGDWLPVGQPIPPVQRQQRLFVRDLMSEIGTTLNAIPYILEQAPTTTEYGASAVAQGVAKPEVEMDFLLQIAPVAKIAAWVPATTEIIEDAPALRGYIDNRLAYMLALREEQQLLFGTGTGAQVHGVFAWSSGGSLSNQTQTSVGTDDLPATVGLAIGKIENVDLQADGAAFNPLDYWQAVTSRHSSWLDNGFGGNAPAAMSGISWGLPAVRSRSFGRGAFGVGAFQLGATIADREQTLIRVGNQHSTFFTENKIAILAEERLALLTHRPDAFVNGTITFS